MSDFGTSASRLRVDDVDPGCGRALRSENRRRFFLAEVCSVGTMSVGLDF